MQPLPNAELLRSLGRLVRGLSALFWGLPISLVVCFHTATSDAMGLRAFGIGPPVASTGLLAFGLWQLADFQRRERVWQAALDRARILSLLNLGLSPYVYWWNQQPGQRFFFAMVLLLVLSALVFLGSLNLVLRRLGAMLPDEALRIETRQFTGLNFVLLCLGFAVSATYVVLSETARLPRLLAIDRGGSWILLLLVLFPLAMTMALLWKTKEVILDSVFGPQH
jgi:hypothetical protein